MVLGDHVEEVGGFLQGGGVEFPAAEALEDVAQAALEGVVLLIAEDCAGIAVAHGIDEAAAFCISEHAGGAVVRRYGEPLVVVVVQQVQGAAVLLHKAEDMAGIRGGIGGIHGIGVSVRCL